MGGALLGSMCTLLPRKQIGFEPAAFRYRDRKERHPEVRWNISDKGRAV